MRFLIKARINKSNKFEKENNNVFKYVGNRKLKVSKIF